MFFLLLTVVQVASKHEGIWTGTFATYDNATGACQSRDIRVTITETDSGTEPKKYMIRDVVAQSGDPFNPDQWYRTPVGDVGDKCEKLVHRDLTNVEQYFKFALSTDTNVLSIAVWEGSAPYPASSMPECPPSVLPCAGPSAIANATARLQLCRFGTKCQERDPFTGRAIRGFDIDAMSNTNRIIAGVFVTLGVLLCAGLAVKFREPIGAKVAGLFSSQAVDLLEKVAAVLSALTFLLTTIACGVSSWSFLDDDSMGLWKICSAGGDCVDSIAHPDGGGTRWMPLEGWGSGNDAIYAARLFMMTSTLLTIATTAVAALILSAKLDAGRANIPFWCSLASFVASFIAVVAWAAFHNDVLEPAANGSAMAVAFGGGFDTAIAAIIFALATAMVNYGVYSKFSDVGGKGTQI